MNCQKMFFRRLVSQTGITLVEMLVAMVIGLILAGGIYQVFVGSSESYQLNTQLARVQESGRFAMQLLRQEIRGAGYLGCAQDVDAYTSLLNNSNFYLFEFNNAIYGLEATGNNTWADNSQGFTQAQLGTQLAIDTPLSGSDIVVIRGVFGGNITMYTEMPPPLADMKVANAAGIINDNDILMISDCSHASVFQVSSFNPNNGNLVYNTGGNYVLGDAGFPGNATKILGHDYKIGAEIVRIRSAVFFIRLNPGNQPALYMKEGVAPAVELVEGVESMQIRYGEDTNNDGTVDTYVNANQVGNWERVRSVRIGLLLRSTAEAGRGPVDNNVYDVSGDGNDDFGPVGDRRLRLVMSGTVGLRNRLR